jgi:hypothetical protein
VGGRPRAAASVSVDRAVVVDHSNYVIITVVLAACQPRPGLCHLLRHLLWYWLRHWGQQVVFAHMLPVSAELELFWLCAELGTPSRNQELVDTHSAWQQRR